MTATRGFTLVELAVTLAVSSVLVAVTVPYLGTAIGNSRARNTVSKFTQDFNSLRSLAASGTHTVTLTLASNCSWSANVDGSVDPDRSMTASNLASSAAGFTCAALGTTLLPVVFTFSPQGFVQPSATFSFTGSSGQVWPIQVLGSGTIVITTGSS